ncbi:MAG: nitroreductase family deazaflavin-dependent oxidoreductase [Anaerolineales bacterium]|nr:nitroreductase family deazaflavin-dependent oxidoreductase [Anaerolineales bacterium]
MTTGQTNNYPPKGLLRLGFRIPVYFYRLKLGWLLGRRFVLINHLGRKTGIPHQAVVEVVERDKGSGNVTVVAGYGQQTQWYQNLKAHRDTIIQIGSHKHYVTAEFITPEEGEEIIVRYLNRYGKLTGKFFSILGYSWDGTEQGARQIARDSLRFVRFMPHLEVEKLS